MCSGVVLLYGIPKVVLCENKKFTFPEEYLVSRGVKIENLDYDEYYQLMETFIQNNPDLWNEDIGM